MEYNDQERTKELAAQLLEQLNEAVDSNTATCMNILTYALVCLSIIVIAGEDGDIDEVKRGEARKEIQLLVGEMFDNIMNDKTNV